MSASEAIVTHHEGSNDISDRRLDGMTVDAQKGHATGKTRVSNKAEWLQDAFKKKGPLVDEKKTGRRPKPGSNLVSNRTKWLQDDAPKTSDLPLKAKVTEISSVSALDRARWLQEQAFGDDEEDKFVDAEENLVGNELVADRMKWLQQQGKKEGTKKNFEMPLEIRSGSAQDRARWLQEQAFRKATGKVGEEKAQIQASKELVSDRMKTLQQHGKEELVKKEFEMPAEMKSSSAQDRARWLQEQAFRKATVEEAGEKTHVERSSELVSDRMERLQQQGKKEHAKKEFEMPPEIKSCSAQDRARWLQEQAFRKATGKDLQIQASKELVSDRLKNLQQHGKEELVKKEFEMPQEMKSSSAQERARWLQEQAFRKATVEEAGEETHVERSNELVSDRMEWLQKQGKEEVAKQSFEKPEEINSGRAQDRARWLQEVAFHQSEEDEKKDSKDSIISHDLISDRMKWLQEMSTKKEMKTEKKESKVSSAAKVFDSNHTKTQRKKTSAVQRRMEELEKQQKEMDSRTHMKVSWKTKGSGPGQFQKKVADERGVAPKKSLNDLP